MSTLVRITLNDGSVTTGPAVDPDCSTVGACCCGFCKSPEQCQFGDCHNRLPAPETHTVGTLCDRCSGSTFRSSLPGHRPSIRK